MADLNNAVTNPTPVTDYNPTPVSENPDDYDPALVPINSNSITDETADDYNPELDPNNSTSRSTTAPVTVTNPSQTKQQEVPNPLHDYESYTYNISLHILSTDDYNKILENPESAYIPQNCLIASGGQNTNLFKRNQYFAEDFYFENLKILSVVNTKNYSRSSNAYQIDFTIIEPNSFTLINRLLDATKSVNGQNYLRQPYLLIIDFLGYKNGKIEGIPNQRKYIPINLLGMNTNFGSKGVEYRIEAAPFNFSAMNEIYVKTPAIFKVKAKTVQDLLTQNTEIAYSQDSLKQIQNSEAERVDLAESRKIANDPSSDPTEREIAKQQIAKYEKNNTKSSGAFTAQGLTDGINAWLQSLRKNTQSISQINQYRVIFDKEIGQSQLYPTPGNSGRATGNLNNNVANSASGNNEKTSNKSATGLKTGQIDFSSGEFTIPAGTNILTVIEYAVRNSSYITDQLIDPLANNTSIDKLRLKQGNSLKWFRVIPSVKLGAYDNVTNRYQMNITYYVRTWTVNVKSPYAPLGRAAGYVKKYNYLFTGKNIDVIDCKIDFDMLYYLQLTADVNKIRQTETAAQGTPTKTKTDSSLAVPKDPIQPYQITHVSQNQTTQNRTGGNQDLAVRAGDTQRDIIQSSRGDMINVNLRIIGDPTLIKQDDIFYNQNVEPNKSVFVSQKNQSLIFDDGELYVFLDFESPSDINDATGLSIPSLGKYTYSSWRGIYKIIQVQNEFYKGKFEQTLEIARVPISDELRKNMLNIQSRTDALTSQGLGQFTLPYSKFSGPQILTNQISKPNSIVSPSQAGQQVSGLVQNLTTQSIASGLVNLVTQGIQKVGNALKNINFDDKISQQDQADIEQQAQKNIQSGNIV